MMSNKLILYISPNDVIYYFNKIWYFDAYDGDYQWYDSTNAKVPGFVEALKVYTNVFDEVDDL
jgi:hypothetical protein